MAEKRGELIPRGEVVRHWQAMVAACRARLLTLPDPVSQAALAARTLPEIKLEVRTLVYEALEELAGTGIPPGYPEPGDAPEEAKK